MEHETRQSQAMSCYEAGESRVKTTPSPKGQKFPCGTRVRIAKDLGSAMSHFESDCNATVKYVHAHAYGGDDIKSYCLDIDGVGEVSWYDEWQLSGIQDACCKTPAKDKCEQCQEVGLANPLNH